MRDTEAISRIRALGFEGIAIAVTGNALPEDMKGFLDHGADAVIPRPFDINGFRRLVLDGVLILSIFECVVFPSGQLGHFALRGLTRTS